MPTDPRYPVGKFQLPTSYSDVSRAAAIATIADLPKKLRATVAGASDAVLDTPYRDGGWTVRQVVHHLADSHANAWIRTRFILTTDNFTVQPYPEQIWAELPDAKSAPIESSLTALDGIHARWATLLRALRPEQFARTFTHPEQGPRTLDALVALYDWHSRHHLAHISGVTK